MVPTSAANGASPPTPLAVAPIDRRHRRDRGRAPRASASAAAVLVGGPARKAVWYWMVRPSGLMNWAEAW